MKVSKLKSCAPKELKPNKIKDIGQFIQNQLESAEINEIGSVKVINNFICVLCFVFCALKNSGLSTVCFGRQIMLHWEQRAYDACQHQCAHSTIIPCGKKIEQMIYLFTNRLVLIDVKCER